MGETIRVLIADDHPLVLRGIRETLQAADDIMVIGEANRGDEVQRLCGEMQPDVLLLDLQMPGPTAVETVMYVREHCRTTRVIILTAYDDEVYVRRAMAAGVCGYVLKDEVADAVVIAIRSVTQGGTWFSRRVFERMTAQQTNMQPESPYPSRIVGETPLTGPSPRFDHLTRQQRKVLRLAERELTNDEIAKELMISSRTVKKHLEDIYRRLDVHDRETATRVAHERGLIN